MNAEFENLIAAAMQDWHVPGLALALVDRDTVRYCQGFGWRDREQQLPVTPDTIFWIASCSKAFTAFALGLLVDDGKLDWDTPVRSVLPDFAMQDPVASERLTVRDLLCHRSGLPRHDKAWYKVAASRHELMCRLAHLAPSKDFRAAYQYQNIMYIVAGRVIEQASGMSWEAFVQQRIVAPLGMSRTFFAHDEVTKAGNFAEPYQPVPARQSGAAGQIRRMGHYAQGDSALGPAGGIQSTVNDLTHWLRMNLRFSVDELRLQPPSPISNPKSAVAQLFKPQVVVGDETALIYGYEEFGHSAYGLGWRLNTYRGRWLVQHNGAIDGFGSHVSFLPEAGVGVIALGNLDATSLPATLAYCAYDRLLGLPPIDWLGRFRQKIDKGQAEALAARQTALAQRDPNAPHSQPLAHYVGQYAHPGYGVIHLLLRDGALAMQFNGLDFSVTHWQGDVFEVETPTFDDPKLMTCHVSADGQVTGLAIQWEPTLAAIEFERVG